MSVILVSVSELLDARSCLDVARLTGCSLREVRTCAFSGAPLVGYRLFMNTMPETARTLTALMAAVPAGTLQFSEVPWDALPGDADLGPSELARSRAEAAAGQAISSETLANLLFGRHGDDE